MKHLWALIALPVASHIAYNGSRIVTSIYALKLEASALVVGVLVALYAILPMFFSVAAGRWSDRGARAPLLIGSIVLLAGTLLPFLVPGLAALFVSSVLCGTGFMLVQVTTQNLIGYFGDPADRAVNFSYFAIGMSAAGFLGPIIAGFGIDHLGHPRTFAILAILPLLSLALIASNRLRLPRLPGHDSAPARRDLRDLLASRDLRRVFIVTTLFSMAWDLYMFVMPIYGTQIGLAASTIGLIMSSFALATFLIRLALPAMIRRFASWQMLATALFGVAAAFAVFPLLSAPVALAACSFALGLGLGSSQPTIMSLLHSTAPPGRAGEAVGLRSTIINFSQAALPLFFGAIGTAIGIAPVFWVSALCLAAGGEAARRRAKRIAASGRQKPP